MGKALSIFGVVLFILVAFIKSDKTIQEKLEIDKSPI
jgi:hypothetical protein